VRTLAVLAAALAALVLAAIAQAGPAVVFSRGGEIWLRDGDGPARRLTASPAFDARPVLALDGLRIAFVRDGDLYVMNVDGSGVRRLTFHGTVDAVDWSPDGTRLVFARAQTGGFRLETIEPRGGSTTFLAAGAGSATDPAWSPDGRRIAFAADRGRGFDLFVVSAAGGRPRQLTRDGAGNVDPAWSPNGRTIAFASRRHGDADVYSVPTRGGSARRLTRDRLDELSPSWSSGGVRIVFARGPGLASIGPGGGRLRLWLMRGADPSWGAIPARQPLFPDLDQLAPSGLVLRDAGTHWQLGSTSQVANRGEGPVHLLGSRASPDEPMIAQQVIELRGGGRVVRTGAGVLRYVRSPEHEHFHFLPFESYELRSADGSELLVRDHKSGFCLGDRRGHSLPGTHARALFTGYCQTGNPRALAVEEGESVGWVDRYPGFYHGQFVDVTGVPAGDYLLVHRANPRFDLLERDYGNDVASLRIRLTWDEGVPRVAVLRTCPGSERC
jgi:hypothetical protein